MVQKSTIGNIVYILNAVVLLLGFVLMGVKAAHAAEPGKIIVTAANTLHARDRQRLAKADPVDQQLARYTRMIPDMGFLRLYGPKGERYARHLEQFLGAGAENMDYAHDNSQREDLLKLQVHRISNMVKQDMPSATLFKLGKDSALGHRYLCVITLNTAPYRLDPDHATSFMTSGVTSETPFIRNKDFLRFTADHEAFHCLNAYFNGASFQKTSSEVTSHYDRYVNEARADAFASLMFKLADEPDSQFLKRFATLRTQALANTDIVHATSKIIQTASHNCLDISMLEPEEVMNIAEKLVRKVTPSRAQYRQHLANMIAAIERLRGNSEAIRTRFAQESLPASNDVQVAAMVKQVEEGQQLIGEKGLEKTLLN